MTLEQSSLKFGNDCGVKHLNSFKIETFSTSECSFDSFEAELALTNPAQTGIRCFVYNFVDVCRDSAIGSL